MRGFWDLEIVKFIYSREMQKIFAQLEIFTDIEPHPAALNMALDEALLEKAERPLLRVYRWSKPSVSFGYFETFSEVKAAYVGHDFVRRWTGGGVVPHRKDFTYSLIVPKADPFAAQKPLETYGRIHAAVVEALRHCGIDTELTPLAAPKNSNACFENPAQYDVLHAGNKIAGAGQRRTRLGLLHQGSIQGVELPQAFAEALAAAFAESISPFFPSESLQKKALAIAAKYGSREWLEKF